MEKVFISYSHDSAEHANKVLTLSDRLISEGVNCILDQYEESPPEGWPRWMDKNIREADFVVMVCTETYYKRVMGDEEPGKGRGVRWEGNLIYQHFYNADTMNRKFIPVLFEGSKTEYIPTPLQGSTFYWVDNEQGYEGLYRRLTDQPKTEKPELGKLRKLPTRQRKQDFFAVQVSLSKLPTTGHELFGRDGEIEILDDAWADENTNILSFVAWGGVGKSALVNEWLNRMENDNYRKADRVYGWSFYSQGTREERQVSGDEFFEYTLKWFGYEGEPLKNSWEKGQKLAELVRKQRTLLILDGLEPLQYPPGPMKGRLKDQGLQALLKELSRSNPGLCILTTREKVEDLEHIEEPALKRIFLENLSVEAGVALLRSLGVKKGTDDELRKAVGEFGCHALALNLLGSYLATVHDGEIRKRDLIPQLTADEEQGGHAKRVMESYEIWLKDNPELDILYMMGLFDRPAPGGAIKALRNEPAIEGLTDKLQNLTEAKWKYAIKHLRELRLLAKKDEIDKDKLDCHPLVREHFGEKLQKERPEAWKEAHGRLYEYYKSLPEKLYGKFLPDTLEEMESLFAAVTHGCFAERCEETLNGVFFVRIERSQEKYCTFKLGAIGAVLAAISNFFEIAWRLPTADLTAESKAYILNASGFFLRALGRLREAAEPMKGSMQAFVKQENFSSTAVAARNLSEIYLTLGNVDKAVDYAEKGIEFANKSGGFFQLSKSKFRLANSLLQAGEILKAEEAFKQAEAQFKEHFNQKYNFVISVEGFCYCDLLLNKGQYKATKERANYSLKSYSQKVKTLLDVGLDNLSLGWAYMLEAVAEGRRQKTEDGRQTTDDRRLKDGLKKAEDFFNHAVDGLREAGTQHYIPRGLLARAELYRYQQTWERAWEDLEETREIAERGEMNLYLADCELEAARICLAERENNEDQISNKEYRMMKLKEARGHYEEAGKRVEEMGYHRRDPEVLLIAAELEIVEGKKEQAKETLVEAKKTIDEMGCHRWDVEVERLKNSLS